MSSEDERVYQKIKNSLTELGGRGTKQEILNKLTHLYGDINIKTFSAHLYSLSVNYKYRTSFSHNKRARNINPNYDFLYKINKNEYEFYDPLKHGKYELKEIDNQVVATKDGVPLEGDLSLLEFVKEKMKMQSNFQPIVIKSLLESDNFQLSLGEIKNRLSQLNFGREDFEVNQAITSVQKALNKLIKVENDLWSLEEEQFDESEKPIILKICGQEIARWHIEEITKNTFDLYHILPGRRKEDFPYLKEFLETNSIGVGWHKIGNVTNFSESEIKNEFDKNYPEDKHASFLSFMNIKPNDIVVLTKGLEEIVDFGIVIGNYLFKDVKFPSYPHRKDIVWLNQGPIHANELPGKKLAGFLDTIAIVKEKREMLIEVLLGKQTMTAYKRYSCFILTQFTDSKYEDVHGKKYHYTNQVPNSRKLTSGSKFIIQSKTNGQNSFVGYGKIREIVESDGTSDKGKPIKDIMANFSEFTPIIPPKIRTAQILSEMQSMPSYGSQPPSILPITRSLYLKITGEDLGEDVNDEDMSGISEIIQIFQKKKNVILYGPPGTGKTYTTQKIQDWFENKNLENSNDDSEKESNSEKQFFMLMGPFENWKNNLSLENPRWATTDEPRNLGHYKKMKIGDYVILKNQKNDPGPFDEVGYFGIGKITKLFENKEPFWPDEIETQKIIWKHCLEFELLYRSDKVIPTISGLPNTKGLSSIKPSPKLDSLLDIISNEWGVTVYSSKSKMVTFHPSYTYEDFVEGIRPIVTDNEPENNSENSNNDKISYSLEDGIFKKICNHASGDQKNDYLLIIDEINRGNIPKIFGELITLIEDNKRNKLSVNLAYSKESFTIPENLYILGTMNTADKSLVQLDSALRRRFAFVELMPKYNLKGMDFQIDVMIDGTTTKKSLSELLEKLNKILKNKKLRDKQIGHSYFLNINKLEDLQFTFQYEVIPLLQDYFYDNYERLSEVLGDMIIDTKNMEINNDVINNNEKFSQALGQIFKKDE